jgi:putative oxidoreductase
VLEKISAMVFPWIELILGGFLILGLWTRICLVGTGVCTMSFIVIVGQAILRRLPLTDCGCFGDLVRLPLPVTLVMDILLWTLTAILFVNAGKTAVVSLDNYFSKKH